ncbi:hypothetical protein JCM8202_003412 [Rhodotorula sphaerocarpa]
MADGDRFVELPDDAGDADAGAPAAAACSTSDRPAAALSSPLADSEVNERRHDHDGADSVSDSGTDVWWTPSELRDLLDRATRLKEDGNREFGQGRWEMAIETYREGLAELPSTRAPDPPPSLKGKEKAVEADTDGGATSGHGVTEDERAELDECRELRAMLSANVAACHLKLQRWKEAVSACDEALESRQDYVKALHRRATANEAIGSWSSLQSALDDWNKLETLPEAPPSLGAQIKAAQRRLPEQIKVQQEKEKEEVLGKLKDLGNMVLGKFGFSTDNFKLQEQPGGGYGLSFQQ